MSEQLKEDFRNTIKELEGPVGIREGGNWLGHIGKQNLIINEMLLRGATKEEIAENLIKNGCWANDPMARKKAQRRIKQHFDHLMSKGAFKEGNKEGKKGHKLPLIQDSDGKWKFDIKKMEETLGVFSQKRSEMEAYKDSDGALPERVDVEHDESMLRRTPHEFVSLDAVLDQIEQNFKKDGKPLKANWRHITKRNIELWFGNQR